MAGWLAQSAELSGGLPEAAFLDILFNAGPTHACTTMQFSFRRVFVASHIRHKRVVVRPKRGGDGKKKEVKKKGETDGRRKKER